MPGHLVRGEAPGRDVDAPLSARRGGNVLYRLSEDSHGDVRQVDRACGIFGNEDVIPHPHWNLLVARRGHYGCHCGKQGRFSDLVLWAMVRAEKSRDLFTLTFGPELPSEDTIRSPCCPRARF